jgi:signal transduction histidine kinase
MAHKDGSSMRQAIPPRGEMSALIRATDWSKTPLGPLEQWPRSLVSYVDLIKELPSPAIIFWGPEQTQIYNEGYAAIMGPRHPLYFGARYKDCWPETYPLIYPWMRKVLDDGAAVEVDKAQITLTRYGFNEECYFSFTFSPLRDDDGKVAGILQPVFEVTSDVLSERRAAMLQQLEPNVDTRDAAAEAIAALSANPNDIPFSMIYLWDERRNALELAAVSRNLDGRDDCIDRLTKIARAAYDASSAREVEPLGTLINGEGLGPWPEPPRAALFLPLGPPDTHSGRGVIAFGISARLHFDAKYRRFLQLVAGQVARAIASQRVLQNARERATLLEREQAARAEAEVANRAKDEFLAMLGHELRNPLAPILTALQLLELKAPDVAVREREIMNRQVHHLVELVDDLLDMSRIARGKIALDNETIELAEVAAAAIETASPLLEQQRHTLEVKMPGKGLCVRGDRRRLAQIVSNLLTNAAKFTPAQGTITISGRRDGDEAIISVRDTGIGIDPDILPHVFELFAQGRQPLHRSQGGLGLGLSIVRSLVEMHGGSVTAESAGKGRGTLMMVKLPCVQGAEPPKSAGDRKAVTKPASPLNVLIVDDNQDAANLLVDALSEFGHAVIAAHDGPSALEIAEAEPPDVAVIDLGLPVMDGYELARRFAVDPRLRRTRLIALTGYGQTSDRARTEAAGFVEHLVKPVDLDRLRQAIGEES